MRPTHRLIEPLETRYAPAALISISSPGNVDESGTTATFTVSLSEGPAAGETITVHYATADGTATEGADYEPAAGDLTFIEGDALTKTVNVAIKDDDLREANETFTVTLSAPTNAALADGQNVATATIVDDDPKISINDVSITEGDMGTKTATFTLTLSAPSSESVSVRAISANATATAGEDYVGLNELVTFNPNETTKTVSVTINADALDEADETFSVNLSAPTNAHLDPAHQVGTATILDDDPTPTVSIADVSILEGDSGTTTAKFKLTLSAPSGQNVTLHATTMNGTAIAGQDYVGFDQDITFAPGQTERTVSAVINGDATDEADETFSVTLSAPVNVLIADGEATGTILNDEIALLISNAQVTEGAPGSTSQLQFTVSLTKPSTHVITVNASTNGGSAAADSDYVTSNEVITFNPGETTKTFSVAVNGDAIGEENETLAAILTSPANARIAVATGTGTILNDDGPTISISDGRLLEGGPGATSQMAFTVTLNRFGATGSFDVSYSTADALANQATAGVDYVPKANGALSIPAGANTGTIFIPILGDSQSELDEQFLVNLSDATGGATITDSQATGTIVNDDAAVISISNATLVEGDAGTANMVFVVTLTGSITNDITVNHSTIDGTATSGTAAGDYVTTTGSVTFTATGPRQQTIAVPIIGDLLHEDTQQFFVQLNIPENATARASLNNTRATGTIFDNNDPVPAMSISSGTVVEDPSGTSNALFTISLTNGSDTPIAVDFNTQNGTATGGADFTAVTGARVTFEPGQTVQTIVVPILDDAVIEGNETFTGVIANAQGATISTPTATATIIDNDIVATINSVTLAEGSGGNPTGSLTVTLSGAPVTGAPVTVNFTVAPGTASAGSDFNIVTPSPLTFNPGETTKQIDFTLVGDTRNEADEAFTVTLTGATNGVVGGNSTGTVTITDDDPAPEISIANATAAEGDNIAFTISLSAASDQQITVKASTVSGTAVGTDLDRPNNPDNATADYTSIKDQLITFAPGETSKTFTVITKEDNFEEPNEMFTVVLTDPTVGTLGTATATGTITNDDLRTLSITDAVVVEGDTDTKQMLFTVTLASAAAQQVSVNYTTANGTATAGDDYVATSGTLTFNVGELSKTIAVTINGDRQVEGDEFFRVVLSSPQNATILDGDAQGRILDDESRFTLTTVNATASEDNAAGTVGNTISFQINRTGDDLSNTSTVSYETVDGTAVSTGVRADFTAAAGTLIFSPGQKTKTVTVQLRPDLDFEADQTFSLRLTGSTNGIIVDGAGTPQTTVSATGTITNNDVRPTVSIDDAVVFEGNPDANSTNDPDTTDMVFTVRLSAANETESVTVDYNALTGPGDTALSQKSGDFEQDFFIAQGTTQTVTFSPGETSKTFVVKVVRDARDEADAETFSAKLSNANAGSTSLTISDDTATGTIRDDDATPTVKFEGASNGDLSIVEGSGTDGRTAARFTLKLSAASERPITLTVNTISGTAVLGDDFTKADSGTQVTFAAGQTSKVIDYIVLADEKQEANETATIRLSNPVNVVIEDSEATLTIIDDDPAPALTINDVTVVEGNSGTGQLIFTVSLSAPHDDVVTVDYASANGSGGNGAISGVAGADFGAVNGRLSFAPNELTKTISVPIFGDTFKEENETFTVALSNAVNATIARDTGIGTITQDGDTGIAISIGDAATVESNGGTHSVTFTVQLSAQASENVTFTASSRNGSATGGTQALAGVDYGILNQTFTIPAGQTTKTVEVIVLGDTTFEPTESFFVTLSDVSANATVVDAEGRGTIYNDDIKVVDRQTVRFVDPDGDLVTLKITKGTLAGPDLVLDGDVVGLSPTGNVGGRQLTFIDFTRRPFGFNGTDLRITADPQPGFRSSGGLSDGEVNVGFVRGALVNPDILEFTRGIDFHDVYIEGDVAKFVAGDVQITPAISGSFRVGSLGVHSETLPTGFDTTSQFLSQVKSMNIAGDVAGSIQILGGDLGDLNSLHIGGALKGGSVADSGQLFFTGTLGQATIGEIIGGSADGTGMISGGFNTGTIFRGANIVSLHVLRGITGGSGSDSGKVMAPFIGKVTVGTTAVPADLIGGGGQESGLIGGSPEQAGEFVRIGRVLINGDIVGGTGKDSGAVLTNLSLGDITVRGSISGGGGEGSGEILVTGRINASGETVPGKSNAINILGDITGSTGIGSGRVNVNGSLASFTLGTANQENSDGDLVGGAGAGSGTITVGGTLVNALIHGSIKGGSGDGSGGLNVNGALTALDLRGSLEGGSSTGDDSITLTGFVSASRIAQITIGGDIKAGTNTGKGLFDSGAILANRDIQSLVVKGNILGNSATPAVIAAAGVGAPSGSDMTIQRLVVNGEVSFLNILGGYSGSGSPAAPFGTASNPDAQIGSVMIDGDVLATNIVAGVAPGADGRFGTTDDSLIDSEDDDSAVAATIARVVLKGALQTNADVFGIVAQEVKTVLLGAEGTPLGLTPGRANDNKPVSAGSNFIVREVSALPAEKN